MPSRRDWGVKLVIDYDSNDRTPEQLEREAERTLRRLSLHLPNMRAARLETFPVLRRGEREDSLDDSEWGYRKWNADEIAALDPSR